MSVITPSELNHVLQKDASAPLIDVRTPAEFEEVRATSAVNIPLDQFDPSAVIASHRLEPGKPVYLICKMGGRSQRACDALSKAGFSSAVNVTGGTDAWVSAGLPVTRGQKQAFSLQRQVQILAGSLALTGALLSFIHPWWALLSAFIGAGLVFSGLTNTCGMGSILARMPWNQVGKPKPISKKKEDCESG